MFSFRLFIEDAKSAKRVSEFGCKVMIQVKVLKVCKVLARLLAAVHLQHLLQVGLSVNENQLMLMI